jgi:hypothetical protein
MIFLSLFFIPDRRPEFIIETGDFHTFAEHRSNLLM